MIAQLRQIFWSFSVLWDIKGITWPPDRLRLWRKSVHLYLSFLAFTDTHRPEHQLRRAMVCALLSAVYDYDSDWPQGKRNGSNFLLLLERYVTSTPAKTLASKLFSRDVTRSLSKDGLERGSAALRFYWLVIDSEWMREYHVDEIDAFGRSLQIVDDLFDLDNDYLTGDTNCLLLPDDAQGFANEARGFLASQFFGRLKRNSHVYRTVDATVRKVLNRFGSPRVRFTQLFATGRPMTAGLYAFVLSIASFRFLESAPSWTLRLDTALGFVGLTMSIMVFNDWKDRNHDKKKGKLFASQHPKELWSYWLGLNVITGSLLMLVAWHNLGMAVFCMTVWTLGLVYSFVPHWYLVQNLIVALCSGAPALCGAVWMQQLGSESALTFLMFVALILVNEIYKDVEDAGIDSGYKMTIPVRHGHQATVLALFSGIFVPATLMTLHPNPWVPWIAAVGIPFVMFNQAIMLMQREYVVRAKWAMQWTLTALLVALLIS